MALSCTQMDSKGSGTFRTYVSALKNPDRPLNRGKGFDSIVGCFNLTIEFESEDLFATGLNRRNELGTVVIPTNFPYVVPHSETVPPYRLVGNTLPNWCSPDQIQAGPPGNDSVA